MFRCFGHFSSRGETSCWAFQKLLRPSPSPSLCFALVQIISTSHLGVPDICHEPGRHRFLLLSDSCSELTLERISHFSLILWIEEWIEWMEWIEYFINPVRSCNDDPERIIQISELETNPSNVKSNLFDVVKPPKLFHTDLEVARPSTIVFSDLHKYCFSKMISSKFCFI